MLTTVSRASEKIADEPVKRYAVSFSPSSSTLSASDMSAARASMRGMFRSHPNIIILNPTDDAASRGRECFFTMAGSWRVRATLAARASRPCWRCRSRKVPAAKCLLRSRFLTLGENKILRTVAGRDGEIFDVERFSSALCR